MPLDPATAAIIQAASGTAATGGNVISTLYNNWRNRRFSREMYDLQKMDNLAFWNMQNEYNSPEMQMQRLKKAGLNPALMYGKGASPGIAGSVKSPEVKAAQGVAPDFTGLGQTAAATIAQYYNTEQQKAQTNNLKTLNTGLQLDNLNKIYDTKVKGAQLPALMEMASYQLEALKTKIRNDVQTREIQWNQEQRNRITTAYSVQESITRIAEMEMRTAKTKQEKALIYEKTRIARKEAELFEKMNVRPQDPLWVKTLADIWNNPEVLSNFFKKYEEFKKDYEDSSAKKTPWYMRKIGEMYKSFNY